MSLSLNLVEGTAHLENGICLRLAKPYEGQEMWLGQELLRLQLRAAWRKLSPTDDSMNPRLIGRPGVGKTTLALCVAQEMGQPLYVMQGTSDTRPDDLLITPVLTEGKALAYVASPLVTAMLVGGVCLLDEGNRMSEKSWASLAALLDKRRYVDSTLVGVRLHAHEDFRFVTTMNDDGSVYDLPEYIQSRLSPQIYLDFPEAQTEALILKLAVPYAEQDLLTILVVLLQEAHKRGESYSVRDGIRVAQYAKKLHAELDNVTLLQALKMSLYSVLGKEVDKYFQILDALDPSGIATSTHLRPL